jgi:hypothetical protein
MAHRFTVLTLAMSLAALGCEGMLIDRNPPIAPGPPPPSPPVLAVRIGDLNAEAISDMVVDPAGGIYVAGTFTGSTDFDPGAGITGITSLGGTDVFVAKYSGAGVLVWVSRIGGTDADRVTTLVRDGSGSLIVGGAFGGSTDFDPGAANQSLTSLGGEDGFVAKLTSDGALTWARRFGGIGADQVNSVAIDGAGRIFATGSFTGSAHALPAAGPTIAANGNGQDAFLLGLSPAGAVSFAFPMGGPEADAGQAVAVTTGGLVVVGGSFRGGAAFDPTSLLVQLTAQGGGDAFLAGYDATGGFQWAGAISGLAEEEIRVGGLAADLEGGVVATGTFGGTADFDSRQAFQVTRTSLGGTDWFAARYDGLGGFRSVFAIGNTGADPAPRPAADLDGTLLLTGWWTGPLDFDPGAGQTIVASFGSGGASDAFVAKYAFEGVFLWMSRFGEGTALADRQNRGTAVAPYPGGGALAAGQFFGAPDFDPGTPVFRLTSLGNADGFIVLLNAQGGLALQ